MTSDHAKAPLTGRALALMSLGALGVVYGDIGTSPLYAIKECFGPAHRLPVTRENVLGILSLVFWSLNFVISFKYISLVMRADNRGEGGILALLALIGGRAQAAKGRFFLIGLALFGAALLYGDGVITPAMSVLSAVEGLNEAAPALHGVIVPLTVVILFGLFWIQRTGTERVGSMFGPVMVIWFIAIAILGVRGIVHDPSVLQAVNPLWAVRFFAIDGLLGFLILGSVVLVVTGGEALYADMGHFGRQPIKLAWFALVLPALLCNYFGQGALLLTDPSAKANPFFALVPGPLLVPMVILATLAAIIASQALISGAFSLTKQAVQLGYSPRVTIVHTSQKEMGQIYIPEVNRIMMIACIGLVIAYRTSSNLAAAYGIAVTGTMAITTVLFYRVERDTFGWSRLTAAALCGIFLFVDLAFLSANVAKIAQGGWFPIAVGLGIFTLMSTWKRGRKLLAEVQAEGTIPLDLCLSGLERQPIVRVPGCAVFLSSDSTGTPGVMLHHLKHNKVLHETVLLLSVVTDEVPMVPDAKRVDVEPLGLGFYRVRARYGFMELPDVPAVIRLLAEHSTHPLKLKPMETSFYLGHETLIATGPARMAGWRKGLFILMSRNARSAATFFQLPPNRVVEMGAQVQI